MALTLTVDRTRWRAHIEATRARFPGLVPVVKGNGYGFGRTYLAELVSGWDSGGRGELAVGTVHELAGLPIEGPRPIVLTPALARELALGVGPAVLTVGSEEHVAELASTGLRPPVVVKLASPMQRYGVTPAGLSALVDAAARAGLPIHGYAVHPPLEGTPSEHGASVLAWTSLLPTGSAIYVSHLDAGTLRRPGHRGP